MLGMLAAEALRFEPPDSARPLDLLRSARLYALVAMLISASASSASSFAISAKAARRRAAISSSVAACEPAAL